MAEHSARRHGARRHAGARKAAPRAGRRAARPAPRRGAGTRKVVLGSLALLAATGLATGGQGTFAYWTDSATATSGSITSGTLDLTVDGAQGNPNAYAKTSLTLSSMVPGESVAASLSVANAGDADFTWVPTVSRGGDLGPALTVELYAGATATNTSSYPRTGTCSSTAQPLTSGSTATRLNKGAAAQNLCVKVTLPAATDNAFQNKTTGSVTIALAATQVLP